MRLLVIALFALAACDRKEPPAPPPPVSSDAAPAPDAAASPPDARGAAKPIPTKLVAAGDSTCAVMSDTTVRCWGRNDHGQLGDGTTTDATRPVTPAIRSVQDLQLADGTACALLDDKSVACWGRIAWQGGGQDVLRPTGVLSVTGVKRLFVFTGRACARVASDGLVCWGSVDARGHFAAATTQRRQATPVAGMDHVIELSETASVRDDGSVWSWNGGGAPRRRGLEAVTQLGEREGAICGLAAGGDVSCVGSTLPCAPQPVQVKPEPPKPPKPAKPTTKPARGTKTAKTKPAKPVTPAAASVVDKKPVELVLALSLPKARSLVFDAGWCVVTAIGGKVQCGDGCGKVEEPWRRLDKIEEVVGRCARIQGGTVKCWDPSKPQPVISAVDGVTGVTALAVGRMHGCAIVAEGAITCWGENAHGQLGRGDLEMHPDAAVVTP